MIALIVYATDDSDHYMNAFRQWLCFYKSSGTQMPFRIFTDHVSDITKIDDYPVTKIMQRPPLDRVEGGLPYSDWLRSALYDAIQESFVYMDVDCFILQPIDDILNIDTPMAMSYYVSDPLERMKCVNDGLGDDGGYNSGVMVFTENMRIEYRKQFEENPNGHSRQWRIYGELIWSDVNRKSGGALDPIYNALVKDIMKGTYLPSHPKILHCHDKSSKAILTMTKWISNALKNAG